MSFFDISRDIFSLIGQYLDGRDASRLTCVDKRLKYLVMSNQQLQLKKDTHLIQSPPPQLITTCSIYEGLTLLIAILWCNFKFNYRLAHKVHLRTPQVSIICGFTSYGNWSTFRSNRGEFICISEFNLTEIDQVIKIKELCDIYFRTFPDIFIWRTFTKFLPEKVYYVYLVFKPGNLPHPKLNINKFLPTMITQIPQYVDVYQGNKKRKLTVEIPPEMQMEKEAFFTYQLKQVLF